MMKLLKIFAAAAIGLATLPMNNSFSIAASAGAAEEVLCPLDSFSECEETRPRSGCFNFMSKVKEATAVTRETAVMEYQVMIPGTQDCDEFSGSQQIGTMSGASGFNAQNRLGGGSQGFLPGFQTLTQGGAQGNMNAWISAEYHKFNGTTEGNSSEFVFGIDTNIGPNSILGFTIGIENIDFTNADIRSVAYGPYFATNFGTGIFDILITKSDPEYTAAGVSEGDRTSVAANFTFDPFVSSIGNLRPFINISGYNEDISNGVSVQERRTILGATMDFAAQGSVQPYLRAALDRRAVDNSVTGKDSYSKPLLGLGLNGSFANGSFNAELGYSHLNSQTKDLSAQLRLDFSI